METRWFSRTIKLDNPSLRCPFFKLHRLHLHLFNFCSTCIFSFRDLMASTASSILPVLKPARLSRWGKYCAKSHPAWAVGELWTDMQYDCNGLCDLAQWNMASRLVVASLMGWWLGRFPHEFTWWVFKFDDCFLTMQNHSCRTLFELGRSSR